MTEPAFKDFDAVLAAKREKLGLGPTFRLGGTTFSCIPVPKATELAELVESQTSGRVKPALDYLRSLVVAAQREEFDAVLNDDENVIDMETVQEIMSFLAEAYNGRPTQPSLA